MIVYAPRVLEILFYLVLGAGAGFAAGLLGIGGGLIIVPGVALVLSQQAPELAMHIAVATSLASIVFTGSSSVLAHHRHGNVDWAIVRWLAPGLVIGAFIATYIAMQLSGPLLTRLFGLFCVVTGWQMWRGKRAQQFKRPLPGPVLSTAGGLIGLASALVGIGGGSLTVPLLVSRGIQPVAAVATAAAGGIPIAVAGAAGFALATTSPALATHSIGLIYLPALLGIIATSVLIAPLGAHLAQRLPAAQLKRVFAVFLALLGINLLLS